MVDASWGVAKTPVADRDTVTNDRFARIEARAEARRIAAQAREEARRARHDERARLATADPHAPGARQPRGSGRKDVVRERRDTTGYAMRVDTDRIRALAARGASVASLAAVLGMDAREIERVLNEPA